MPSQKKNTTTTKKKTRPARPRRTMVTNRPRGIPNTPTSVTGNDSTLVVCGEELAYVLSQQTSTTDLSDSNRNNFWPGASGMSRLDQYGRMFEQYRVDMLEYNYRTSSGTVTNGASLMAFDYESSEFPTNMSALQVLQPRARVPVWENAKLRIDPSRANKSRWMFTAGGINANTPGFTSAGMVVSSAPHADKPTEYGEVWCKYRITFNGPTVSTANNALYSSSYEGVWNSTYFADTSHSFKVGGLDTKDLRLQPYTPGEYFISAHNDKWDKAANNEVFAAMNKIFDAAKYSYRVVCGPADGDTVYPAVLQWIIDVTTTPGHTCVVPASIAGATLALTAYRSGGSTGR